MLPREFYSKYGVPRIRGVAVAAGATFVVPFNMDRYLLGFLGNSTQPFTVFPNGDQPIGFIGAAVPIGGSLFFTMELHGSLPCVGCQVFHNAGTAFNFQLIEGIALEPQAREIERGTDEAIQKLLRDRWSRNGSGAWAAPRPQGADPVRPRSGARVIRSG